MASELTLTFNREGERKMRRAMDLKNAERLIDELRGQRDRALELADKQSHGQAVDELLTAAQVSDYELTNKFLWPDPDHCGGCASCGEPPSVPEDPQAAVDAASERMRETVVTALRGAEKELDGKGLWAIAEILERMSSVFSDIHESVEDEIRAWQAEKMLKMLEPTKEDSRFLYARFEIGGKSYWITSAGPEEDGDGIPF
jgi:hypothetical protein